MKTAIGNYCTKRRTLDFGCWLMLVISFISHIPGLFLSLQTMPAFVPIRQPTNGFGATVLTKPDGYHQCTAVYRSIASAFDLSDPKYVNSQTGNQPFSVWFPNEKTRDVALFIHPTYPRKKTNEEKRKIRGSRKVLYEGGSYLLSGKSTQIWTFH